MSNTSCCNNFQGQPCNSNLRPLGFCVCPCGATGSTGSTGTAPGTRCDCCIKPLQDFLQRFKQILDAQTDPSKKNFQIGIVGQNQITSNQILSIDNFLLSVAGPGNDITVIPLCEIVGIRSDLVDLVTLTPPPATSRGGECACCEEPLRSALTRIKNQNFSVDISTTGGGDFGNISNVNITAIGEGIVIVEGGGRKFALSICQITRIDVRIPQNP